MTKNLNHLTNLQIDRIKKSATDDKRMFLIDQDMV